ncbi:MAG: MlaE family ABC transporter permease [Planctomycetota bacterium JB042]
MDLIRFTGHFLRQSVRGSGYTVRLFLSTLARFPRAVFRLRALLDQMYVCGIKPLPVVVVVSIFTGIILAYQTGLELDRFGQREKIADIIGIVLCREMGPFIVGIILTASVGAAMAAELGTMKVSEELDAIECMSIDPLDFLVMPRILALGLMCPVLTFLGDIVGIIGGGFISEQQLQIPWTLYVRQVIESLTTPAESTGLPKDLWCGLLKALVFGLTIATIGCSTGLRATGGALGVGRATRGAVVISFTLIIIFGYYLTWFFYP